MALVRASATADLARTSGGWVNASRRYSLAWPEPSLAGVGAQQAAGDHGYPVPECGLSKGAAVGRGWWADAPRG